MNMLRGRHEPSADEENPYWISFSDIMSALLVLFILAAVALIMQIMSRQNEFDDDLARLEAAEQVRRSILHETADILAKRGIRVTVSSNESVLRIPNDLLGFGTGEFNLQPRYEPTALEIGAVLVDVITKHRGPEYLDTVFVEGHTDSRPFRGPLGKGNWGLSTFRAISLWDFWSESLPTERSMSALKNPDGDPLFSVSGYGSSRPVTQGVTEADYRQNRRVDIRFTIRRPDRAEYDRLRASYIKEAE